MSKHITLPESISEDNPYFGWQTEVRDVDDVNEKLDILYKTRDRIGEKIDRLTVMGYGTDATEKEYDDVVSVIHNLCWIRRKEAYPFRLN